MIRAPRTLTYLLTRWCMPTTVKTCFKCLKDKPFSEFYRHSQMADGHLNKCKDCARLDVRQNRQKNHDYYIWYDRIRSMDEHRVKARVEYANKHRALSRQRSAEWGQRNSHKKRAHSLVKRALDRGLLKRLPCEVCGKEPTEAHHDDYDKPLHVRWLCTAHHGEHHRQERWFGKSSV